MQTLANIFWLGRKELRSLFRDPVLLALILWGFSLNVYLQAASTTQELHNGAIGVVDEDRSELSRRIISAFLPPLWKPPQLIAERDIVPDLDRGKYTFILDIPPNFERYVLGGRNPGIQLNIDATAMVQAGLGSGYAQQIIDTEIANYVSRNEGSFLSRSQNVPMSPVTLAVRIAFNPNDTTSWFTSVMGIVNNINLLAIILAGAAIVREREHGTMDHLLVMPLTPFEIAMSKIWANGLVIAVAAGLSLEILVRWLLKIPIVGSVPLFMAGAVLYLFFATSVGIFLGTIARSMPQLGLLYILVAYPLMMLSGSNTPLESMAPILRTIMEASPSTYFVSFAQAILFRGAGFDVVWPQFLAVTLIGGLFCGLALLRFRAAAAQTT
jgi:ABC-2 type transport system permease protein